MAEASVQKWFSRAKWLFKRVEAVGQFITRCINFVLVALAYVLAVGPLSLLLRLSGRDLLETSRRPDTTSFWHSKPPTPAELERFRRQF